MLLELFKRWAILSCFNAEITLHWVIVLMHSYIPFSFLQAKYADRIKISWTVRVMTTRTTLQNAVIEKIRPNSIAVRIRFIHGVIGKWRKGSLGSMMNWWVWNCKLILVSSSRLLARISISVIATCFILSALIIICCFWSKCPLFDLCWVNYSQRGVIAYSEFFVFAENRLI